MTSYASNSEPHAALVALQNELGRYVVEEHAVQRETMHRRWATHLEDRLIEGRCITGLKVVAQPSSKRWVLECEGNDSRFREGDFVRLSRGDPQFPFMEASLLVVGDNKIELLEWRAYGDQSCAVGQGGICIDESFIDLEDRYRGAIEDLGKTEVGREVILPLLRGALKPALDATEFNDAADRGARDGLNDKQAEAVASALACDTCWLIQGPPGTGKTHVLAWVIIDLLERGERIFVTSFTHRAINNLLTAIAERLPERGRVAKIAPYLDPSLPAGVEQGERFTDLSFAHTSGASGYVIGATPFALRSTRIGQRDFDTIVVDEASQVTTPLAVMAMLAGRKYIFAGDHQQLPPVSLSRPVSETKGLSIFGRLVGRGYDTMLTTTHRLNEELCRWPSDTFYHSKLRSHPRAAGRTLMLSRRPAEWPEVFAPTPGVVWLAVPHRRCTSHAPEESTLVAQVLRLLNAGGLAWKEIGVVVPFRRQARLLRKRLASLSTVRQPPAELVIDTVERMQGQEREVVIVSFTTSDEDFAHRLRDFLFQAQRLNVAATRPRTKLVLVASPVLLAYARSRSDDEGANAFISLLESAHRIDVPLPDYET